MEHERHTPIKAKGYTKVRGGKSDPREMTIEAQFQTSCREGGVHESAVFVRVGAAPQPGDRAMDDLAENSVALSLEQAREFAEWILAEAALASEMGDP